MYRPVSETDFAAMQALDLECCIGEDRHFETLPAREQAGRLRTSLAALRFYARSEHSFVCVENTGESSDEKNGDDGANVHGFLYAQSVWMGDKPIVYISSLRVHPDAPAHVLPGLLQACIKSAYDSAVYEIHLFADEKIWPHAAKAGFKDQGFKGVVRHLGSRAQTANPHATEDP